MSTTTLYMVEWPGGYDSGPYYEDRYHEAKDHARQVKGRVVAYEYEYADSYTVDDFTREGD